jgi:CubicO group peptidase (beta-lactamase class C family)
MHAPPGCLTAIYAQRCTHVRDIADMASGMEGAEDSLAAYSDPNHKHYQFEASLGLAAAASTMPESVGQVLRDVWFSPNVQRVRKAGEAHRYTSANTEVLSELLERVTCKPLPQIIGEMLWSMISAENGAYFLLDPKGVPIPHAGMGMTLHDLARCKPDGLGSRTGEAVRERSPPP